MAAIIVSIVLLVISVFLIRYTWKRPDWLKVSKVIITISVVFGFITFAAAAFIMQYVKLPDELIEEIMK
jgi:hypothetical protein